MSNAGGFKSLVRYYDMLAGNTVWNPWSPTGAYDALATVTVPSGGSASVTFSGIPNTYKHLQIRSIVRGTYAASLVSMTGTVNGSAYTRMHSLYGDGSGTGAYTSTSTVFNDIVSASATSGIFSVLIMDILDYANTSKVKTFRNFLANDRNGAGQIEFQSHLWNDTSAVTSLSFSPGAGNFAEYSQFALYGVR